MKNLILKTLFPLLLSTGTAFAGQADLPDWFTPQKQNYPYYVTQTSQDNTLQLLNSGIGSLQKRIEMIRRAKTSINAEYYIFETDQSGRILLQEMIEAEKRGVEVRILVDNFLVLKLDQFITQALKEKGVEVKLYNKKPTIKASTVNFRTHKKMLTIDDKEAIIGGRNIGDEYFDLATDYNFIDRDVWIKGPMAKVISDNFQKYWEHDIARTPKDVRINERASGHARNSMNIKKAKLDKARKLLAETQADRALKTKVEQIGGAALAKEVTGVCPKISFVTDKPGATFRDRMKFSTYKKEFRILKDVIAENLLTSKDEVFISSPYMIHNKVNSGKIFDYLIEKNVGLKFYTHSLQSTDALYISAAMYNGLFDWVKRGVETYLHDGKYYDDGNLIEPKAKDAVWGTHTKTIVFDRKTFMIGSYNIDNRSAFYNTESAIFCEGNQTLTDALLADMDKRVEETGLKIIDEETAVDADGVNQTPYSDADQDKKDKLWWMQKVIGPAEFIL